MTLETNLSRSPYFDDFQDSSQYYRVLYKPGVAVQTRELNQVQAILQDQINKFGRNIFKEGSIIEGCTLSFDNKRPFVKVNDTYTNSTGFTIADFQNQYLVNANGLKAIIIDTKAGYLSQAPDTNTLYIKYLNSALYPNSVQQSTFDPGETLTIQTSGNVAIGNISAISNTGNAIIGNVTGYGYSMTTTSGVVFKKGTFLYVTPQTILVEAYDNKPDNVSVGFEAPETIITAQANGSLYDNAAGAPNYSAPGADRLQIAPTLTVRTTTDVTNTSSFFSLADFKQGAAVSIHQTAQYSSIGAEMARRTYETNGDFVVSPFVLTTQNIANTSDPNYSTYVNLLASKGLGYVEGYRVEYLNNNVTKLRKGVDKDSVTQQIVTTNFGNYVYASEFAGEFGSSTSTIKVELHNVAKAAVTSGNLLGVGYSTGTKIGYAYVRGFAFDNGTPGTPAAQYRLYLFDVQMNPGANFKDVKSVIYYDSGVLGVADVALTYNSALSTNIATLTDAQLSTMIFPFGQKAIDPGSFNNTEFVYKRKQSVQFTTGGQAQISIPSATGGTESFPYTVGLPVSSSQENEFYVVATSMGNTANKSGNVTVYTANVSVFGDTATTFLSDYRVGDYIGVAGETKQIVFIANDSYMNVASVWAGNHTNVHQYKVFPAGSIIPFSNYADRTINITTTTTANLALNASDYPNSPFNVDIYYNVNRSSTIPISKTINRNVSVKIDCSTNPAGAAGPWSLGLPDVVSVDAVYISTSGTYSNSGTNVAQYFKLDNGQRDSHYDLASISLISGSPISSQINGDSTLFVEMSVFTKGTSAGKGFFTANSYPIDDVNTSNTNAITTAQIPLFTTNKGTVFDLRDCVDFRPYASNTAAVISNTNPANTQITINPSSTLAFSGFPYLPVPDSNFQTDLSYYLQRIDRAALDIDGNLVVTEGVPAASNPIAPLERSGTMTLGLVQVPPYPSLSTTDARTLNRYDYAITATLSQNKRFTMKDIRALEKRIENIEYYTSLSLLEQAASNLLVRSSSTGQNRFQNGIFVDPFRGFDLSNTLDPKYYISIDAKRSELRPSFAQFRSTLAFDPVRSGSDIQQHGELVMLAHTSNNAYIKQGYASKYRNCIEGNVYQWNGTVTLDPPGTISPDITTAPTITNDLDLASNWINLQNAWGTQWGNWSDVSTTSTPTLFNTSSTSTVTNSDGSQNITTVSQNITQTNTKQQQIGTQLNTTPPSSSTLNLGNFVTNISILPYLKASIIRFTAHGLKPNTRLYAYFGNVPVSNSCAPANASFDFTALPPLFGNPLYSDANGNCYGLFYLQANTFKSQDNDFVLNDISDLTQGEDAIQTKASVTFYGSNLSFEQGQTNLRTRTTVLSSNEVTQTRNIQGVGVATQTTTQYIPPPPPVVYHGSGCGCKIICTKLYELGLMDEETFKADQAFGELLRENDPEVYDGYIRWASIVVDWLNGNAPTLLPWATKEKNHQFITDITYRIATPWAQHMAYIMGVRERDNFAGKFIMAVGKPISKLVSKLPKSGRKTSRVTEYVLAGTFYVIYTISKLFGNKAGFPEPINI